MLLTSTALKGSDHLDFILDHRLFRPISTSAVENLYKRFSPGQLLPFEFLTRSQIEDGAAAQEKLIMPAGAHNEVARVLGVPELSGEIERAVWQVEQTFHKQQEQSKQQLDVIQQKAADEKEKKRNEEERK